MSQKNVSDNGSDWCSDTTRRRRLKKLLKKAIAAQIQSHLINNDIVDNFYSAYKAGHSCKTALLRVYNDSITTIGRGNGAMFVVLDLSAAFKTIDHDNLFCILEIMSDFVVMLLN